MNYEFIINSVIIFIAMIIADVCWAFYFIKVNEEKPMASASFGTLIYLLSAFSIKNYSDNMWYLIPACIGAFIGTYLTVYLKKYKKI